MKPELIHEDDYICVYVTDEKGAVGKVSIFFQSKKNGNGFVHRRRNERNPHFSAGARIIPTRYATNRRMKYWTL